MKRLVPALALTTLLAGCFNSAPPPTLTYEVDGQTHSWTIGDVFSDEKYCEVNDNEIIDAKNLCTIKLNDTTTVDLQTDEKNEVTGASLYISREDDSQYQTITEQVVPAKNLSLLGYAKTSEVLIAQYYAEYEQHTPGGVLVKFFEYYGESDDAKNLLISFGNQQDPVVKERLTQLNVGVERPSLLNFTIGEKFENETLPGFDCDRVALFKTLSCEGETEAGEFNYVLMNKKVVKLQHWLGFNSSTQRLHAVMQKFGGAKTFEKSRREFSTDTYFRVMPSGDVVEISTDVGLTITITSAETWMATSTISLHRIAE